MVPEIQECPLCGGHTFKRMGGYVYGYGGSLFLFECTAPDCDAEDWIDFPPVESTIVDCVTDTSGG